jgi:predicted RNA-binding protein YlxR (DUF448 family)
MAAGRRAQPDAPDAADEDGGGSERTCIVTREKRAPEDLIRFVVDPAGVVVPDIARRLPGRGVWVCIDRAAVEKARASRAFSRAFKRQAEAPDDLADRVDRLLADRLRQALSLALKSGAVVTGFMKVDAAIASGSVGVLVHASEAAADGRAKLDRKLHAIRMARLEETGRAPDIAVVDLLGSAELSLATGRANVVHAALTNGGAARNFAREAERLRRYRSNIGCQAAASPSTGLDTDQA